MKPHEDKVEEQTKSSKFHSAQSWTRPSFKAAVERRCWWSEAAEWRQLDGSQRRKEKKPVRMK